MRTGLGFVDLRRAGRRLDVARAAGFPETASVIGQLLLDKYALPFEIASALLLVAVVGAIVLVSPEPAEEDE